MSEERLSRYFSGIATKHLSAVEADQQVSHQHELNGVSPLKGILGRERVTLKTRFIFIDDFEENCCSQDGTMTWYDARENHPTRSEYRLYYSSNVVMKKACEGDFFALGMQPDNTLVAIVAKGGTISERQLAWLFGVQESSSTFRVSDTTNIRAGFVARYILDQLGIETRERLSFSYLEDMLRRFNGDFPSTREFSAYARETLGISSRDNPDEALLIWLEREEILFRMLEKHLAEKKIREGFNDIDEFVNTALSIINRRKSRVGAGFENHLEYIFKEFDLTFSTQKVTENKSKPDFVFPCIEAYHRLPDDAVSKIVTILGAKYSCKDRWRQVLAEGNRINKKYLITVEAGISSNQTTEMENSGVKLIVPNEILETYSSSQRISIINLRGFIEKVKFIQENEWRIHGQSILNPGLFTNIFKT